jgi:tetratricopeptide (TPR) repeat protein
LLAAQFTQNFLHHPDMSLYADVVIARARIEFENPEAERNWLQIATGLGMAGSFKKIVGQFNDAEKLLIFSLHLIKEHNLANVYFMQQSIRIYDVYKRLGRNEEAAEGLTSLIQMCTEKNELKYYLDVALQHLGKVYFVMKEYQRALSLFHQALELRRQKKDQNLIESSETAIEICLLKINQLQVSSK